MTMTRSRWLGLVAIAGVVAAVSWAMSTSIFRTAVAVVIAVVVLRVGFAMISGLATPQPEPPEPGLLRKVKIAYRCSICGAEVRMTIAPDEDPDPPRHCMEDMDLVSPIE